MPTTQKLLTAELLHYSLKLCNTMMYTYCSKWRVTYLDTDHRVRQGEGCGRRCTPKAKGKGVGGDVPHGKGKGCGRRCTPWQGERVWEEMYPHGKGKGVGRDVPHGKGKGVGDVPHGKGKGVGGDVLPRQRVWKEMYPQKREFYRTSQTFPLLLLRYAHVTLPVHM